MVREKLKPGADFTPLKTILRPWKKPQMSLPWSKKISCLYMQELGVFLNIGAGWFSFSGKAARWGSSGGKNRCFGL